MTGSAKQSIAPRRHCERSEAIHLAAQRKNGLLRSARNDVELQTRLRDLAAPCATRWLNPSCALLRPSLRAQRSNPSRLAKKEWIASSLRSSQRRRSSFNHAFAASPRVSMRKTGCTGESSLRANGSRECAPDDRLREAIHRPRRHCERSEAIHLATVRKNGLLRFARNDVELQTRLRGLAAQCAGAADKSSAQKACGWFASATFKSL